MKVCENCGSTHIIKKGSDVSVFGNRKPRLKCKTCGHHQYDLYASYMAPKSIDKFAPTSTKTGKKYVITSIQNNTKTNHAFLDSLENYCQWNAAELIVIPLQYNITLYDQITWDIDKSLLVAEAFTINNMVNVLGDMNIEVTAENPLSGTDALSKGISVVIPHNQLMMKSLPVTGDSTSVIMVTTGTISEPNYEISKAGYKAEFNHSYSAILIDCADDMFHMRVLNADDKSGFYDIDGYYTGDKYTPLEYVEALVTGDEHVYVMNQDVAAATYTNPDSIVNILKPKHIIRHDVLDCFTISHHHQKDHFLQYAKKLANMNNIEQELNQTISFIEDTTPPYAQTYLVSSNHNEHLARWLKETSPKSDHENAIIFHHLTLLMLLEIKNHSSSEKGICKPDPFELYCKSIGADFKFIGRTNSFKLFDIELSNHGDRGANGSRGSANQYAKLGEKVIIGHSHTPGINKGAYSVGSCTGKDLEYVSGPSSWMNTHCIIYPNGKRQLINIINGKWR